MKDLLVMMHRDRGQEARLSAALALTRALDALLTCLDVTIMPERVANYVAPGSRLVSRACEEANELENRAQMLPRLEHADVPFAWVDARGDLADCLVDASGLSDLVILSRDQEPGAFPDIYRLTGEMLLRLPCPVLAVADQPRPFQPAGHALVAWDGTPGAAAALRAAMPLLKLARHVTLVTIELEEMTLTPQRAASYCGRHGVHPVIRRQALHRESIGEALVARACVLDADYLVMGAYGHHPMREALFGGVTRHVLRHSPVPLLLAHPR